jgi:predicted methyltransferase
MNVASLSGICALILLGCTAASAPVPAAPPAPSALPSAAPPTTSQPNEAARAVVSAADRSAADRALDDGRKPAELLSFLGAAPGMRVMDLCAGGGYTAELLARAVAPSGVVYGQNPKFVLGFAEQPWSERLATPAMKNAVRVDAELDAPWPAQVRDLDLVTLVLFYHDTVWLGTDRAKLNANVLAALKPGGAYVVVDHSARPGDGISVAKSFHRIEESVVKDEVTKAGFVLDSAADFLREPSDTRDWSASPREAGERRGHSDRFVLRFKKP